LLDHIFIDLGSAANNPVKGWGFWERPTQSGPYEPQVDPVTAFTKRKFVGLTADFLSKVQRLNDYEKAIADSQVPNNGLSYSSTLNGTTTPIEVTVQAALAHEIGHIVWASINNIEAKVQTCHANGSKPFDDSWQDTINRGPLFKRATHRENVPIPEPPTNVSAFLTQRRWASLFAAQDPVEDFAETYRLHAITAGNSLSLQITNPVPVNLSSDVRGSSTPLGLKRKCIEEIDSGAWVGSSRRRGRR
jgi:hypothetical protein